MNPLSGLVLLIFVVSSAVLAQTPPPTPQATKEPGQLDVSPGKMDVNFKRITPWLNLGLGFPLEKFKFPILHYEVGAIVPVGESRSSHLAFPPFLAGGFYRSTSVTHEESITYSTTGYVEKRKYLISNTMLGPRGDIRVMGPWSVHAGLGLSMTQSVLNEISTTAPAAPSLSTGYTKNPPLNFGYLFGVRYEYRYKRFGFGGEAQYVVTSLDSEVAFKELTVAASARYYFNSPLPNPEPQNEPAPASEPGAEGGSTPGGDDKSKTGSGAIPVQDAPEVK